MLPAGTYTPPASIELGAETSTGTGLLVRAAVEDGREMTLRVDQLPLPGWHEPVAVMLARHVGPAGSRRTRASAAALWFVLRRFLLFLNGLPRPPLTPETLTVEHLEAFLRHRAGTRRDQHAVSELREVGRMLRTEPLAAQLAGEIGDYLSRRRSSVSAPLPGYSDAELHRLVSAARSDVVAIRRRVATGWALVERYGSGVGTLPDRDRDRDRDRDHARDLAEIADTGVVPSPSTVPAGHRSALSARRAQAEQLYLTPRDVLPLLVLLAAVTGRNGESLKELPAQHRLLEDKAVEVRLTKRRGGPGDWGETVTWEIGRPDRQLHTPGGLYLLLLEWTAASRRLSGTSSAWSIWSNGYSRGTHGTGEHYDPFATTLAHGFYADRWAAGHGLLTDDGLPLPVSFNRIRTSIEVRRTKQMGGHLPSAARAHTVPVLFANYLRNDPTTIDWARDVLDDALRDAEQAALDAHQHALAVAGRQLQIHPAGTTPQALTQSGIDPDTAAQAAAGALDTAWSACTDHAAHPATGRPCRESFLACFHCGNCLITRAHLPRLLALLDALASRREQMSQPDWWARYGPTWAAIRHDVLSKFSPAERDTAAAQKPDDALLDLVENPWEQP